MADLFIVGQFYGVDSITAVANGSQVLHMLTVIIVGLAMGTTDALPTGSRLLSYLMLRWIWWTSVRH